jgi:hypothetical protein
MSLPRDHGACLHRLDASNATAVRLATAERAGGQRSQVGAASRTSAVPREGFRRLAVADGVARARVTPRCSSRARRRGGVGQRQAGARLGRGGSRQVSFARARRGQPGGIQLGHGVRAIRCRRHGRSVLLGPASRLDPRVGELCWQALASGFSTPPLRRSPGRTRSTPASCTLGSGSTTRRGCSRTGIPRSPSVTDGERSDGLSSPPDHVGPGHLVSARH